MIHKFSNVYSHGLFVFFWIINSHISTVEGSGPHHRMDSYVIPLIFTGIIFMILIGILIFWLYKDNQNRLLGCVPCRKLFMKHKHLDDVGVFQRTLLYKSKPLKVVTTIDGQTLSCPCQRFKHVSMDQSSELGQSPDIFEGQNGQNSMDLNMTLEKNLGQGQVPDITYDVIKEECDRCHGCQCTPVTIYRKLERATSCESNASDSEVALSLTPEINFIMCKGCKCGCSLEQQSLV